MRRQGVIHTGLCSGMRGGRFRHTGSLRAVAGLLALALCGSCGVGAPAGRPPVDTTQVVVRPFDVAEGVSADPAFIDALGDYVAKAMQERGVPTTFRIPAGEPKFEVRGHVLELTNGLTANLTTKAELVEISTGKITTTSYFGDHSRALLISSENNLHRVAASSARKIALDLIGGGASLGAPLAVNFATPHSRPVFVTDKRLPEGSYTVIGTIDESSVVIQTSNHVLDLLADQARRVYGADAVMDTEVWWRPTWMLVVIPALGIIAPQTRGTAVRLKDPCMVQTVKGTYRPTSENADMNMRNLCVAEWSKRAPSVPAAPATEAAGASPLQKVPVNDCSTDQILSMKNSGMNDSQIRRACEK